MFELLGTGGQDRVRLDLVVAFTLKSGDSGTSAVNQILINDLP